MFRPFIPAAAGRLPQLWPVSPLLLIAVFPLLPTSYYLNRGYTIWYHWVAVVYALTCSPFVRSLLILQGCSVSAGWYTAILFDYVLHNTVFLTLYKNTPLALRKLMLDDTGPLRPHTGQLRTDSPILRAAAMVVAHLCDALAHPGLAYGMWRLHCRANGQDKAANSDFKRNHLAAALTLPVIGTSFALCRVWCLVHTAYNQEITSLYYMGHDVYNLDHLQGWLPAYAAEAVVHGLALFYWASVQLNQRRILKMRGASQDTTKSNGVSPK